MLRLAYFWLALGGLACGGTTSTGNLGDASIVDGASDSAGDARGDAPEDANHICTPGTCIVRPDGGCEMPMGPTGNGCCGCNGDQCGAPCRCAAYDTPIATPDGDRAIASLVVGDLVYSEDRGALRAVPIVRTSRVRVERHVVVRITLANGTILRISPLHPTADGRAFSTLKRGDLLDQIAILDVATIPYDGEYTHDILPDSDTGTYVAGGALVGSTLR